ncbi:MAG: peptidase, partial [Clostridia bacterium]|nr:peptidase [Clostridia bacterium]
MKKALSIMIAIMLVFGLMTPFGMTKVEAAVQANDAYNYELDIDPYLNAIENDPVRRAELDAKIMEAAAGIDFSEDLDALAFGNDVNFTFDGGTKRFLGYDNTKGYYYKTYTLRSIGEHVEVWVANDLSFPPGDNRVHVVTQQQVDMLRDEFDNNIYQKDTEFFGMPDSHDGSRAVLAPKSDPTYYMSEDGIERVIMLVDNCRDENYYDPTYPFYVAGFFSSTYERYFDRNIINIDSNKWETRIANNSIYGTVAHEFQHLIHRDNDDSEETWINEGMSDFAEYLCGYE